MVFRNIVFFSPSKITGGAEYYFIRLAEYVADHYKDYRVYYTEFQDGFGRKVISSPNVYFINYEEGVNVTIPENSVICISSHLVYQIQKLFSYNRNNSVFMMWFMHYRHLSTYFTMGDYFKVGRKFRAKVGKHIEKLTDLGVLQFLGNIGYLKLSQQFLFSYHPINALPIPISTEKYGVDVAINRRINDVVRFCWLGRLDKEKSKNILTYMNELEYVNKTKKVSLSIIGVGPAEAILKHQAKRYPFKIEFVGEKREKELDSFIRENVDIGLASGTSSMEFALRKVPVIQDWLLDRVYQAGKRDTYYLYGQTSIISEITSTKFRFENMGTFYSKFSDLMDNYIVRCEEAYKNVMLCSVSNCCEKFISAVSTLEQSDMKECYEHIDALAFYVWKAKNNWKEKLHLYRIFVPLCKILSIEPAAI